MQKIPVTFILFDHYYLLFFSVSVLFCFLDKGWFYLLTLLLLFLYFTNNLMVIFSGNLLKTKRSSSLSLKV